MKGTGMQGTIKQIHEEVEVIRNVSDDPEVVNAINRIAEAVEEMMWHVL
jgi:hypothetical protein